MKNVKNKKRNSHKSKKWQKFQKIIVVFWKTFSLWFFLNCPGGNSAWKYWEKSGQPALPSIDCSSNTISQIWNTWRVKIVNFRTIFNSCLKK